MFLTPSFFLQFCHLHTGCWFQSSEAYRYWGHGFSPFYQKCGKLLLDGPESSGRWAFKLPRSTVPSGSGWGSYYLAYHSSESPLICFFRTMYHAHFSPSHRWIPLKWRLPWQLPSTRTKEFHFAKTGEVTVHWIWILIVSGDCNSIYNDH